jgi:hypothetical protein
MPTFNELMYRRWGLWNLARDIEMNFSLTSVATPEAPKPERFKGMTAQQIYEILLKEAKESGA